MFSSNAIQSETASTAPAGTIVVLIDESSEMATPIAGGTKPKAESVATAVNSMLNQLSTGPNVRLVIVGYGGPADGDPVAQIRWSGPLSGRAMVNSSELAAAPALVEERIRRIPGLGGIGVAREETIQFPIWYVSAKSGPGGVAQAAGFVSQILAEAGSDSSGKPPMVIHVCGRMPTATELLSESMRAVLGISIWCHLHLGANDRIPATLYPSSSQHLTNADAAELFEASSILTDSLAATLRASQVAVAPGGRGMVHQAGMGDLIRFLTLAKAYASSGPHAFAAMGFTQPDVATERAAVQAPVVAVAAPHVDGASETYARVALIVLADRSQADPTSGVWLRRQEQVNDMLGRIAKRAGGDIDVGMIAYGDESVEVGFPGPLSGNLLVPDVEMASGAIRVDEVTEKVSNGIGGLVELKRSRPIFLECDPSEPTQELKPVTAALMELMEKSREVSENRQTLTLVMHVTGGDFSPEAIATMSATLATFDDLMVYHSIVPETPQRTLAYPADVAPTADPRIVAFWHSTSLLAGADKIAEKRPAINRASRGLVVGARFDLLLDSIQAILVPLVPDP